MDYIPHDPTSRPSTGAQDTQLMPTQVYENYYMSKPDSRDTDDQSKDDTLATGDNGHIDLTRKLCDENEPSSADSYSQVLGDDENGDDDAQVTDHSEDELSSSAELRDEEQKENRISPFTPDLAGQKRNSQGAIISSIYRTPAPNYQGLFSHVKPRNGAGLSQIFNQTQADSSSPSSSPNHLINPRSDPVFDRPSPDFTSLQRHFQSAPPSSPTMNRDDGRHVTEPRTSYTPVDESQRRRNRARAIEELKFAKKTSEDDTDWGDSNDVIKRMKRLKKHHSRIAEARDDLAHVRDHGTSSRINKHRRLAHSETIADFRPSVPSSKKLQNAIDLVSDEDASDADSPNDEYDEFSQTTRSRTRSDKKHGSGLLSTLKASGKKPTSGRPSSSPLPRGTTKSLTTRSHFEKTSMNQRPPPKLSYGGTDLMDDPADLPNIAISDSQPNGHMAAPTTPASRLALQSSITSHDNFVSQSQLETLRASHSSGMKTNSMALPSNSLYTSSIARPPATSSQGSREGDDPDIDGSIEERLSNVSSSPPVVHAETNDRDDFLNERATDDVSVPVGEESSTSHNGMAAESYSPSAQHRPPREKSQAVRNSDLEDNSDRIDFATGQRSSNLQLSETNATRSQNTGSLLSASQVEPKRNVSKGSLSIARSNSAGVFETAPTWQNTSTEVKTPPQTPRSNARGSSKERSFKKMSEIAGNLESPQISQSLDFDVDLVDEDDQRFNAAISTPPQARPLRSKFRRTSAKTSVAREATQGSSRSQIPLSEEIEKSPNNKLAKPSTINQMLSNEAELFRTNEQPVPKTSSERASLTNIDRNFGNANDTANSNASIHNAAPQVVLETPQIASKHSVQDSSLHDKAGASPSQNETREADLDAAPETSANQKGTNLEKANMQSLAGAPLDRTTTQESDVRTENNVRVSAPNRVFAMFRGSSLAFYPATCLGRVSASSSAFRIRFDDEKVDNLEPHLVKRLELKKGDLVRIDRPGNRNTSYQVIGLKAYASSLPHEFKTESCTDIYGNSIVVLVPKTRRNLSEANRDPARNAIDVPIHDLYMSSTQWPQCDDRIFQFANQPQPGSGLRTPTDNISAPPTPTSRRRSTQNPHQNMAGGTRSVEAKTGIFAHMAFAVTFSSANDQLKTQVTNKILQNGGRVLEEGFDCLFQKPDKTQVANTSTPSSSIGVQPADSLKLKPQIADTGFAALIADCHSRRTKYIQALALNIPCLHARWITNCASNQQILDWDKYLLPAGASSVLGGAIKSRVIIGSSDLYSTAYTTRLQTLIEGRPKWLRGQTALIVMGKASERLSAYMFLTHALGADRIVSVQDIAAAETQLQQGGHWDWIYVEDSKLRQAKTKLLGQGSSGPSKKKRKVDENGGTGSKPRIVSDEFVVQSLILGSLVD